MPNMDSLFSPLRIGSMTLSNRIVMPPNVTEVQNGIAVAQSAQVAMRRWRTTAASHESAFTIFRNNGPALSRRR